LVYQSILPIFVQHLMKIYLLNLWYEKNWVKNKKYYLNIFISKKYFKTQHSQYFPTFAQIDLQSSQADPIPKHRVSSEFVWVMDRPGCTGLLPRPVFY